MLKDLIVKQDEEAPVPVEILADAIVRMSEAMTKLQASGLNEDAIIILTAAHSRLPKTTIRTVLHSLASLKRAYTTVPA